VIRWNIVELFKPYLLLMHSSYLLFSLQFWCCSLTRCFHEAIVAGMGRATDRIV